MSFHVTVYYEKQLNDFIFIKDNMKNRLTSALIPNNTSQSDPQELFCLSWVICLHKTSQKILLEQGYVAEDIKIDLASTLHKDIKGFYLKLTLKAGIKNLSLEQSKVIFELAHARCPISKIIHQYPYLEIITVDYQDIVINVF